MDRKCPHCGAPMHAQMVICIKCGGDSRKAPAGASAQSPPRPAAARSSRGGLRTPVLAIAALAVTAGLVAGGVWARGFMRERALRNHADFAAAEKADSLRAYQEYILRHAGGAHAAEAQAAAADRLTFKLATTNEEFEAYLAKFPDGRHAAEVKAKLDGVKAADLAAREKRLAQQKKERELAAYYDSIRPKRASSPPETSGGSAGAAPPKQAAKGDRRDEIKVYIVPWVSGQSVSGKITNLSGSPSPKSPGKISALDILKCHFISKAKPYDRIAGRYRVTATLRAGVQRATHTATFTVTGNNNVHLSFKRPKKPKMSYVNVRLTEYTELRVTEVRDLGVDRKCRGITVAPPSRR